MTPIPNIIHILGPSLPQLSQPTSRALQMLPPLVTYLDAARACAAADVPAAMALAMEMTDPATGI